MHTPLLIAGAVLLLVTVYAALLWVVGRINTQVDAQDQSGACRRLVVATSLIRRVTATTLAERYGQSGRCIGFNPATLSKRTCSNQQLQR